MMLTIFVNTKHVIDSEDQGVDVHEDEYARGIVEETPRYACSGMSDKALNVNKCIVSRVAVESIIYESTY